MLDLLSDLNEPQIEAVTTIEGPLLVLAGAGSGKTRVITRRIGYMVQQGIAPWRILAITFTNKAAGEMRERVEQLGNARGAVICTFHSLCARLLRDYALDAGLEPNFSIYDRADQLKVVKDAMSAMEVPTDRLRPAQVHATISNAKNDLVTCDVFAQSASDFYSRKVAGIYRQYERCLRANNALDFDDLLLRMAKLLCDRPDVRQAMGERFQYIMIDEYQDTNRVQYLLAHAIAAIHGNICVTGDPDQSIYAWRGADIRNILEFEQDYPAAKVVLLEENYRSTTPILDAASRLIEHNRDRKPKRLWTRREGGADVHVVACDNEHAEAQLVARRIGDFASRGGSLNDVAIFYRVNSLSRVLEEALLKQGTPYRIARGVEFYNRKEIKDVLAYLRVLVNPVDDVSCERIINTPARGIGRTSVTRLLAMGAERGVGLLEACRHPQEAGLAAAAGRKVAAFADLIASQASKTLGRPVRDIIDDVYTASGLEESYRGSDEDSVEGRANIEELITTAAEFDTVSGGTLAEYLHQVSLVSDTDHFEGGQGAVTLMTLHAAKGLEFPVVFIVGWEEGLLPFIRETGGFDSRGECDMQEERRLAFVGMTRAMRELTLTHARSRMVRGRTLPQAASPFLEELRGDAVSYADETTGYAARPRLRGGFMGGMTSDGALVGDFHRDADERAAIEAAMDDAPQMGAEPQYPPEYEYLREGCRVRHSRFGEGRVVRLRHPWPQTRAEIAFDEVGPKTISLAHTTLELVEG